MADEFVESSSEGWFSRIMDSIKGVLVGLALFVISFGVLGWNEYRSVTTYKANKEGAGAVVEVSAEEVSSANEGKLVCVSGEASTDETLVDGVFNVSANALKLVRSAEMYQWKENKKTESKKKLGGGKEKVTTYTYEKVWSEDPISSGSFKQSAEHQNPGSMAYKSETFVAANATLGTYNLTQDLVRQISGGTSVSVSQVPPALTGKAQVQGGGIYIGNDPSAPRIGDIRVNWKAVEPSTITVVAQQAGQSFQPYQTKVGKAIIDLRMGQMSAAQVFEKRQSENKVLTWILRLVGFLMMAFGIGLVLNPIVVLGDVVPFIGSLLGAGIFIIATGVAFVLSVTTIAICWVAVRPMIGIPLLILAIAGIVGLVMMAKKGKSAAAEA